MRMTKASLRVYYAHCLAIYNTPQELRDVATLATLGLVVDNPNRKAVQKEVARRKAAGDPDYMTYFRELILTCDVLAFRALPDGRIPAGVAKEIQYAREAGKSIIELPSNLHSREMSLASTREYLQEVGQR